MMRVDCSWGSASGLLRLMNPSPPDTISEAWKIYRKKENIYSKTPRTNFIWALGTLWCILRVNCQRTNLSVFPPKKRSIDRSRSLVVCLAELTDWFMSYHIENVQIISLICGQTSNLVELWRSFIKPGPKLLLCIQSLTASYKWSSHFVRPVATSDMILNPVFYLEKVGDYTSVLCCLIGVVLHLPATIGRIEY